MKFIAAYLEYEVCFLAEAIVGFRFSHADGVATTASHRWTSNSIAIAVGLRWGTGGR